VSVRYAIRCGICNTAVPLVGQMLEVLSSEVTDFMAAHDHVNRDFAVVPVVPEVAVSLTAHIPLPAKAPEPDRVDAA
jgi:hypothetical protein